LDEGDEDAPSDAQHFDLASSEQSFDGPRVSQYISAIVQTIPSGSNLPEHRLPNHAEFFALSTLWPIVLDGRERRWWWPCSVSSARSATAIGVRPKPGTAPSKLTMPHSGKRSRKLNGAGSIWLAVMK